MLDMNTDIKEIKYEKGKTKEGLKYLLYKDDTSYSIYFNLIIKVGANEDDKEGTAHFLEHMLFKSNNRVNYKKKYEELEFRGAAYNGGTSYDYTRYHITLPYTEFKYGFTHLQDLVLGSKLDKKEVEIERKAIHDEIKKDLNDPWVLSYHTVKNNYLQQNSPYTSTILGTPNTLDSISLEDIKGFYHKYGVKNITLGVSGNFKKSEIEKEIENFSSLVATNKTDEPTSFSNAQVRDPGKIVLQPSELSKNPIVSISTLIKGRRTTDLKENLSNTLFQRMFAKGGSSALYQGLIEKSGQLYSYGLDNLMYENVGLTCLNFECASERFYEILKTISSVTEEVKSKGFNQKQLNHWKKFNLNRFLISNDNHQSTLDGLLWNYFYDLELNTHKQRMDILQSLTLEDVHKHLESLDLTKYEVAVIGNIKGIDPKKIKASLL